MTLRPLINAASAFVTVTFDSSISYVSAVIAPDSIERISSAFVAVVPSGYTITALSARKPLAASELWVFVALYHSRSILITSVSIAAGSNASFAGVALAAARLRLVSVGGLD